MESSISLSVSQLLASISFVLFAFRKALSPIRSTSLIVAGCASHNLAFVVGCRKVCLVALVDKQKMLLG